MWCGGGGGARVPGIPYTRVENLLIKKQVFYIIQNNIYYFNLLS